MTGQGAAHLTALRGRGTDAADLEILVAEAAAAVEAFERIQPDAPWAEASRTAEAAIDALRETAHVVVFPRELQPASAAAIADFALIFEDSRYTTLLSDAIELHDAAVATYPDLATLIRSERLRRQLRKLELPTAAADQAIAEQCVVAGQLQPHSGVLAETVPELQRRVETQRATRQDAAARAIAAQAATEADVAAVRAEAFARRRQELAARAERLPGSRLLVLPGERDPITARLLAHHLERAEDADRLDQLEAAIAAGEASR